MKALLLVAHGSRREASNDEVRKLTDCLRRQSGQRFGDVRCAFLELADPSIPDGIEQCIEAGAAEVVVVPYFLSAGRHVVQDIPEQVALKQKQYPDRDIQIVDYLGTAPGLVDTLLGLATAPEGSA
jgi:sirohydrochlorin ferrochelatase